MIEFVAATQEDMTQRNWVLRPNQALAPRQIASFFGLVLIVAILVTGFSWLHGNVFAPLFALLQLALLGWVFRVVWRRAARVEVIQLHPRRLSVSCLPGSEIALEAHPQWVRLQVQDGKLFLACGGRQVRVGVFLGEAERERLRQELEHGLRWARDRDRYRSSEN